MEPCLTPKPIRRTTYLPGSSRVEGRRGAARVRSMTSGTPGSAGEPTRIVIADDHSVVRSGLRMLLDAEPDLEVVAEAGDVRQRQRYVRGHKPAVLILDLNMPGEPSLPGYPGVPGGVPDTQIVVLTMQDDPAFAREAMRAGALGYVLKEAADAELVEAVRHAAAGSTYLHPRLGARLAAEPARDSAGWTHRSRARGAEADRARSHQQYPRVLRLHRIAPGHPGRRLRAAEQQRVPVA